jgi:hypothetical protein
LGTLFPGCAAATASVDFYAGSVNISGRASAIGGLYERVLLARAGRVGEDVAGRAQPRADDEKWLAVKSRPILFALRRARCQWRANDRHLPSKAHKEQMGAAFCIHLEDNRTVGTNLIYASS